MLLAENDLWKSCFCSHISQFVRKQLLDHLAADGVGFTVGQVNAYFLSDKHLETVHGLREKENVQLIAVRVAHYRSLLFRFP